jgi:DNA integrity scanning protein DisA with diadenylate cyclase activity
LKKRAGAEKVIIAADTAEQLAGAREEGLACVELNMAESPIYEKLTQAVLEAVADDLLPPGSHVVAIYSGFEPRQIDSISFLRLEEHLGRLTVRDLRQLETRVPLDTLKTVVDLAVEIGREGREGKRVGTMFVVGDIRNVLAESAPSGFDPLKGYPRKERSLNDKRVREGIKEIAQLDGAFIVSADGTVEKACQILDTSVASVTLTKGLGARHWAGAAISKKTNSIAVVVSETNGTVRLFQNGEVVLRIEPFRRAMKWTDFEYESPALEAE